MPLLYHWRRDNYYRDLDWGAGYHLNQSNPLLHGIEVGDSLWAFTRRRDGIYVLAAALIIAAKTLNPTGYRYGRYRVWGDLKRSRYFSVDGQPDITGLVRQRLSILARGDVLGQAFQGHAAVRRLLPEDHQVLVGYAKDLPLEPRARLLPEEQLEAVLLLGDPEAVAALIRAEPSGLAEQRRQYLMSQAPRRDRDLVLQLREIYRGRCQICSWDPVALYGVGVCEAHHVRWLSRGGTDALENLVLICPNHHRSIHASDAPFDFGTSAFLFANSTEPLRLVSHDLAAVGR